MSDSKWKGVTVGMPTFDSASNIEYTLNSVLNQQLPDSTEMEVIVCANGCTDGTESVVESFASRNRGVELISIEERGKSLAKNSIRGRAKSDVIVYVDDDIRFGNSDVIRRLYEDLQNDSDIQIAGGKVIFTYKDSWFLIDGMNRIMSHPAKRKLIPGAIHAVRRDIGVEIPTDVICDDAWLTLKLEDDQMMIDEDAVVFHDLPSTVYDWIRYRARTEAGIFQLKSKYGLDTSRIRQVSSRLYLLKELPLRELAYLPAVAALFGVGKLVGGVGYDLGWFDHGYGRARSRDNH